MAKEIATVETFEANFPVLTQDLDEVTLAIQENLDDEFDPFILEQIRVPSGGTTVWEREDRDPEKELVGVIIGKLKMRSYWRSSFESSGGNTPPDCSSSDMENGLWVNEDGTIETRKCATCPFSRFGSGGARSQACKQMEMLFVLLEGEILPTVIKVPPSSLRESLKYRRKMTSLAIPYWAAVTGFQLEKDKNQDGITYSKIRFVKKGVLEGEAREKIKAYRKAFLPVIEACKSRNLMMGEANAEDIEI